MKRAVRISIKIALYVTISIVILTSCIGWYLSPTDEPLHAADAIVVISGGGDERIERGVALYHQGLAPLIVASGAAHDGYISNAAAMRHYSVEHHVPPEALAVEEDAVNTYENAVEVEAILAEYDVHSIILVTSTYHQRRAFRTFAHVLGESYVIQNAPAQVDFWSRTGWWRSERGRYLTAAEFIKIIWSMLTGKFA